MAGFQVWIEEILRVMSTWGDGEQEEQEAYKRCLGGSDEYLVTKEAQTSTYLVCLFVYKCIVLSNT